MSMLSRLFDPGVKAEDVPGLEHHPAFRILHNDLQTLIETMGTHTKTLKAYLENEVGLLDTYLSEGGTTRPGQLVTKFDAQTHDVEMITTIVTYIPASVTSATLTLDDWVIPLPTGEIVDTGLNLPVRSITRTLTLVGLGATETAFILINARPVPANMDGILH